MRLEEIWAALAENGRAPHGPVRIVRGEYLVDAAEAAGDAAVLAQALIDVIEAYEFGAEQPKMLVPFAQLLRLWDESPQSFDRARTHSLFWYFKWTTGGMIGIPEVPLASISRWLEEMESRYRQAGYSPRAVHMGRHRLAREAGDEEVARSEFQAWLDAARDPMADCHACELGDQGWWMTQQHRDEDAIRLWRPVLDGESFCAEEPHRVLAHSLMPLVRLGRVDEARANHLRGYRLARGVPNLRAALGRHLEFCALTGNEARGLEILAEHAGYLAEGAEDAETRLEFLVGVAILVRRLIALGLNDLELADTTVADAARTTDEQIRALCARFDSRNGNAITSERVARRLAQQPLDVALPIGSATLLPAATGSAAQAHADAEPSGISSVGAALDDLIAEAHQLTEARHPHAPWAWERVAASGAELPEAAAAQIERFRAKSLMERDPAGARTRFLVLAERFERLGQAADAREVRASAAFSAYLAGDPLTAELEAVTIGAEAETAYAAGELTSRQYLGARNLPVYLAYNALGEQINGAQEITLDAEGDEARAPAPDPAPVIELIETEQELADRLGDPGRAGTYGRMLMQLAYLHGDRDEARARIEGARDRFLAAGQPWDAAEPETLLAQIALTADDPEAAEQYARAALEHVVPERRFGAPADPDTARPGAASLLVEAISRQPDRHADLVGAALHAAQLWDGISEPDALNNRFIAARAYLAMKRYAEAAALYDELMPRVEVPYYGPLIAMTREHYGECLTQLGEHREAAAQYLAAAQLLQGDADNRGPYARLAWTAAEALQNAGLPDEALPAYRQAADLWRELNAPAARARCLRSAAWLLTWTDDDHKPRWAEAIQAMHAVLAELEAIPADGRAPQIDEEIDNTVEQLERIHSYAETARRTEDLGSVGFDPSGIDADANTDAGTDTDESHA